MEPLTAWAAELSAQAYSITTVRHRVRVIRCMARAAGVRPDRLRREHVAAYLAARAYAPRTRENYLASARLFGQWIDVDLTDGIRRPRVPRGVPRPVGEAALARMLLAASPQDRAHAWVVLGAYVGLRSIESAGVRSGDLEESGQGGSLRVVGKGGVERLIPAPPIVVETVQRWSARVRPGRRLWPQATPSAVQCAVRRAAEAAGVICSSHQLRHRYGTAVYRVSRDLLLTQQLMGHASPTTTAGYALVVMDEGASVVSRLPGAGLDVGPTAVLDLAVSGTG